MNQGTEAKKNDRHARSRTHWIIFGSVLFVVFPLVYGFVYLVNTTANLVYQDKPVTVIETDNKPAFPAFPVGVNPKTREITELPNVDAYLVDELSGTLPELSQTVTHESFVFKTITELTRMDWFQNMAAGEGRILIIEPGERKEEIAYNIGKILKWDEDDKREFLTMVVSEEPVSLEGKFTPGSYVVSRTATPHDVAALVLTEFEDTIRSRYYGETAERVPLHDALTIASLLEREARDFTDMRYIAGVIWNRLFIDMNLQIDATLQYARGNTSKRTWWPKPVPKDKYIDSTYNTYEHSGLPPTPIANPSPEAILAALNPRITDCLYYFHDKKSDFHCSKEYSEHVAKLKKYYGRGK